MFSNTAEIVLSPSPLFHEPSLFLRREERVHEVIVGLVGDLKGFLLYRAIDQFLEQRIQLISRFYYSRPKTIINEKWPLSGEYFPAFFLDFQNTFEQYGMIRKTPGQRI